MDNKEKGKKSRALKSTASHSKSDLLGLARKLDEISPREAERLRKIINRLEDWQKG